MHTTDDAVLRDLVSVFVFFPSSRQVLSAAVKKNVSSSPMSPKRLTTHVMTTSQFGADRRLLVCLLIRTWVSFSQNKYVMCALTAATTRGRDIRKRGFHWQRSPRINWLNRQQYTEEAAAISHILSSFLTFFLNSFTLQLWTYKQFSRTRIKNPTSIKGKRRLPRVPTISDGSIFSSAASCSIVLSQAGFWCRPRTKSFTCCISCCAAVKWSARMQQPGESQCEQEEIEKPFHQNSYRLPFTWWSNGELLYFLCDIYYRCYVLKQADL